MKLSEPYDHVITVLGKTTWWDRNETHEEAITRLDSLIEQIERHVDDVDAVFVTWDTYYACSFCKSEWERDENGCPTCCDAAIEEWKKDNG